MRNALLRNSGSDAAIGAFRRRRCHRHDLYLLAIGSERHLHSTRGTRESGQVVRNVLPLEAHWPKADLAAVNGYCGCPG